ncbi:MAG: glycoside hydrolase family 3 C-terminal domain-containing protein [Clostridia bacterium]|nr:glycoside hydrolase family 3 C-terminal domain-containing protein [Clostridia bacterium]
MKYDINKLTLDEKLNLLMGDGAWKTSSANGKLRQVVVADGPSGLRKMYGKSETETETATAMPTLSIVASTWDEELARLDGATIADDCIEHGVDVLLAPGANVKRTPLNGRNFEYLSEDPYLAGTMARGFINGVQEKGIGTSLKHYAANNREIYRLSQSSEIGERALREIYLRPFEIAVKAQPWTVMCSYNAVNGVLAAENGYLLKEILRDTFGFEGLIVSDWGAVYEAFRSVKATLDLRMPQDKRHAEQLKEALDKGYITMDDIDYCVNNVLKLIEKAETAEKKIETTKEQRHENAVNIAKAGMVLLKNEDNILPLKNSGNYFVAGGVAIDPVIGGIGSALVQTEYKQKPLGELLAEKLPNADIQSSENPHINTWAVRRRAYLAYLKNSLVKAYGKDAVIIGVNGEEEGESFDRRSIRLEKEYELIIKEFAKYNKNIIVLLNVGSAIDVSPWIDDVKAVLYTGFSGEGINEAAASILVGETNPSGKLAETFPICLYDTYTGEEVGNGFVESYTDGVFVGYRHYDKYDLDVAFPFGFGLSYSKFKYDNLRIEKVGECDYKVLFDVENISGIGGAEVAQLYIKEVFPMVERPEKELKGFKKVFLKAGEKKTVEIELNYRSFAYYLTPYKRWHVQNDIYEIMVGASSRDIRLQKSVKIELPPETQQSQINKNIAE